MIKTIRLSDYALAVGICCATAYEFHAYRYQPSTQSYQEKSTIDALKPGDRFPTATYTRAFGKSDPLSTKTRVIYWFSAPSPKTKLNRENVLFLAATLSASYQVIGIVPDHSDLDMLLREQALTFPIYVIDVDDPVRRLLGTPPATFVVDPSGVVQQVWRGLYGGDLKAQIEAHFRVRLPFNAIQPQGKGRLPGEVRSGPRAVNVE